MFGAASCSESPAENEPVSNAPAEELISARVVNKETEYVYRAGTNYYILVSYDDENIHIGKWKVSKFTYDACVLGYTATKYSDGITTCLPATENTSESENEETEEEETEQPVENVDSSETNEE